MTQRGVIALVRGVANGEKPVNNSVRKRARLPHLEKNFYGRRRKQTSDNTVCLPV
jgi:hypothetical protein